MPAVRDALCVSSPPLSAWKQNFAFSGVIFDGNLSELSNPSDADGDLDASKPPTLKIKARRSGRPKKSRISLNPTKLKASANQIKIKGIKFPPTAVFDTFWRFAAERKAIDDRRRAGKPPPWTDDIILQEYAFCNTYRILDKVSQYIIKEVIETGSQDPQEVLFRVILFNTFTKIETWELLDRELGPLAWQSYQRRDYERVLGEAREEGLTLYTGAFQKPAPRFGSAEAHINHLCLLEVLMDSDLLNKLQSAKYLAEVYEYLLSFPGLGEFSAFQLLLNLLYTKLLHFSNMDFVIAGPGASSGLAKMFGAQKMRSAKNSVPGIEEDIIRWLAKNQKSQFERLGLEFSGLGPDKLPMDLADIEHTLCEVDKYSRKAHPLLRGKRSELRCTFTPSPRAYPPNPVLPESWSDQGRRVPRIWPGPRPQKQPRYVISCIKTHRDGTQGREYKVSWLGYTDAYDTWEPEHVLQQDAPLAVQEYVARL